MSQYKKTVMFNKEIILSERWWMNTFAQWCAYLMLYAELFPNLESTTIAL